MGRKNWIFSMILLFVWMGQSYAVDKVDINTADAATLDQVMVGIGAKKAEAIVKYRQEHGAFKSLQDLENVAGIGAKTIENNKDKLIISVGVNQVDAATLVKMLNGISTELATALVEYRNKHGAFKSVDEIAQVPGWTKEVFERNKDRFSIVIPAAKPEAAPK
jgi:competence protein ComEA